MKRRTSDRKFRLVVCEMGRRDPAGCTEDALKSMAFGELLADSAISAEEVAAFNRVTLGKSSGGQWVTLMPDAADPLKACVRSYKRFNQLAPPPS